MTLAERSISNCKLCKETPIPSNFASPRRCAFDENGIFTRDNWNCVTAGKLRDLAGESCDETAAIESMCVRRDDQSYAAIYVPPSPEDIPNGEKVGEFRGGGFIAMTWYKHRGATELMIRVDGWDQVLRKRSAMMLTLKEAESAIENLTRALK